MLKKLLVTFLAIIMAFSTGISLVGCDSGPKTFTVTFNSGASDAQLYSGVEVQTVNDYTELDPPTYVRRGYNFDGWTIALNQIKKSTVVKAMWTRYEFSVTFNANGGEESGTGSTKVERKVGSGSELVDVAPLFVKTGYELSWDTDLAIIRETCIVNAVWTPKKYNVSFVDTQGNQAVDVDGNPIAHSFIYYNTPIGELPRAQDKEIDGQIMRFTHWSDEGGVPQFKGTYWSQDKLEQDGSFIFKANWSYDEYVIDYDLAGGYSSFNPVSYSGGAVTSIQDPLRKGYDFIGWTSEEFLEPTHRVEFDSEARGDKKLTANWQAKTYTFTLDYNGGSAQGVNSANVTFDQKVGAIKTPERANYEFIGWTYGNLDELITSETVWNIEPNSSENVLVAQYRKIYTLKFTLSTNYKKNPLTCVITDWADLSIFDTRDITQIEIKIKEGQSLSNFGITMLPVVDPIEPATGEPNGRGDDYYFLGYWKYVTRNAYNHEVILKINPDTVFNEKNFLNIGEDGIVVIEPSCLSWYTN